MIAKYYREGTESVSEDEGTQWQTKNIFVPLKEFPKDLILRFNLDSETVKEQTKIDSFTEESPREKGLTGGIIRKPPRLKLEGYYEKV